MSPFAEDVIFGYVNEAIADMTYSNRISMEYNRSSLLNCILILILL